MLPKLFKKYLFFYNSSRENDTLMAAIIYFSIRVTIAVFNFISCPKINLQIITRKTTFKIIEIPALLPKKKIHECQLFYTGFRNFFPFLKNIKNANIP